MIDKTIEKYLTEEPQRDKMHGGDQRRAFMKLYRTIDTFMQETMVEIEDEIFEFQRLGGGKEDVRKMKIASDEAHERLKYLKGMMKELSES